MKIKVALDWLPNTTYTGFYLAEKLGYYDDRFLDVIFMYPSEDNYKQLPAKKVIAETAHFAIVPPESLFENHDRWNSQLYAVATIFQSNISYLALQPDVVSPRNYASLRIPYETATITQIFPDVNFQEPHRLDGWEMFKQKQTDAVWIFDTWEGAEAEFYHIPLQKVFLETHQIPYLSCPLLVTSKPFLGAHHNAFARFLEATALGFQYAVAHPKKAVEVLAEVAKSQGLTYDYEFLSLAQHKANDIYLNPSGQWGLMNPKSWHLYYNWLKSYLEISSILDVNDMFSNSLLCFPPMGWE